MSLRKTHASKQQHEASKDAKHVTPEVQAMFKQLSEEIVEIYKRYAAQLSQLNSNYKAINTETSKLVSIITSINSKLELINEAQQGISTLIQDINTESINAKALASKQNIDLAALQNSSAILNKKLALLIKIREKQREKKLDVIPSNDELTSSTRNLATLLKETINYFNQTIPDTDEGENKDKIIHSEIIAKYEEITNKTFKHARDAFVQIKKLKETQQALDDSAIPQCKNIVAEVNAILQSKAETTLTPIPTNNNTPAIGKLSYFANSEAPQDKTKVKGKKSKDSNKSLPKFSLVAGNGAEKANPLLASTDKKATSIAIPGKH